MKYVFSFFPSYCPPWRERRLSMMHHSNSTQELLFKTRGILNISFPIGLVYHSCKVLLVSYLVLQKWISRVIIFLFPSFTYIFPSLHPLLKCRLPCLGLEEPTSVAVAKPIMDSKSCDVISLAEEALSASKVALSLSDAVDADIDEPLSSRWSFPPLFHWKL